MPVEAPNEPVNESDHIDEILAEIERIWRQRPDYRLGQVICQALPEGIATNEIYYMRDDRLLQAIRRKLEPSV